MNFIQGRFHWNFPAWLTLKGAIPGSVVCAVHSPLLLAQSWEAGWGVLTLQGRKPDIATQG